MNIMPPRFLNSLNTDEVVSARMLEAYVGTPPSRLLIFTGIAMPGLESNGQLDGQEVRVDLNARSNVRDPQYTATVGLASIYNEDTDLIFATDDVRIDVGPDLGLTLVCNIATMGDKSVLHRFAYQATVLLQADNGTIRGTIRWDPHFLVFSGPEHDLFRIEAWTMQTRPDTNGFVTTANTVVRVGATVGSVVRQGNLMGIEYTIQDLPLGVPITVTVNPKPDAFLILNAQSPFTFVQVSGPIPIMLRPQHLAEQPVDFEARPYLGTR